MSVSFLRHHLYTFSFLPGRRDRQVSRALRTLRIRVSRRKLKQFLRSYIYRNTERRTAQSHLLVHAHDLAPMS